MTNTYYEHNFYLVMRSPRTLQQKAKGDCPYKQATRRPPHEEE